MQITENAVNAMRDTLLSIADDFNCPAYVRTKARRVAQGHRAQSLEFPVRSGRQPEPPEAA